MHYAAPSLVLDGELHRFCQQASLSLAHRGCRGAEAGVHSVPGQRNKVPAGQAPAFGRARALAIGLEAPARGNLLTSPAGALQQQHQWTRAGLSLCLP